MPGKPVRLTLVEVPAHPDVTVCKREHRLRLRQVVDLQGRLADGPGLDRKGRVLDHVSSSSSARSFTTTSAPWRLQRLGLADAIDADHVSEVARAPGGDTGESVLEHRRLLGLDADGLCAGEERVGRRLALQMLAVGDDAVDDLLEQVQDSGVLEHVAAIRARGNDRPAQLSVAGGLGVFDRALIRLHALLADDRQHELVLAVAETVDRLPAGVVARRALWQLDPARGEERADAVVTRLAVDVLVVVGNLVELDERLVALLRALAQILVEHLLPGGRVDLRGLRQHAVEVEQTRRHAIG